MTGELGGPHQGSGRGGNTEIRPQAAEHSTVPQLHSQEPWCPAAWEVPTPADGALEGAPKAQTDVLRSPQDQPHAEAQPCKHLVRRHPVKWQTRSRRGIPRLLARPPPKLRMLCRQRANEEQARKQQPLFTALVEKLTQIGFHISTPSWVRPGGGPENKRTEEYQIRVCRGAGCSGEQVLLNVFISDLQGAVNRALIKCPDDTRRGGAAQSQ